MLKVKIATVEKVLEDSEVRAITVKTTDGVLTILKNHIPVISVIKNGYYEIDGVKTNVVEAILIVNDDSTVNIMISEL